MGRFYPLPALLLFAALTSWLLGAPPHVTRAAFLVVRAYAVLAVGLLAIRSSVTIVNTLEAMARHQADTRGWVRYYEPLRPLVPTFRACLEYALWIAMTPAKYPGWCCPLGHFEAFEPPKT